MRKDSSRRQLKHRQSKYPMNTERRSQDKLKENNGKKLSRAQQKQRDYMAACEYDW